MTSLIIKFGRYAGSDVSTLPESYVRWLADPARGPLTKDIVTWAQNKVAELDAGIALRSIGQRALQGHPNEDGSTIYVIECEGDCWSKSGPYAIQHRSFETLDETLAYLASEYPADDHEPVEGVTNGRACPDPEDDKIIVWEVLPSGHRKAVWGFFGWHHDASEFACGQGCLPGDSEPLQHIACRD